MRTLALFVLVTAALAMPATAKPKPVKGAVQGTATAAKGVGKGTVQVGRGVVRGGRTAGRGIFRGGRCVVTLGRRC